MDRLVSLLGCMLVGLALFGFTLSIYLVAIWCGWATISGVFVACIAINNIAVAMLVWLIGPI